MSVLSNSTRCKMMSIVYLTCEKAITSKLMSIYPQPKKFQLIFLDLTTIMSKILQKFTKTKHFSVKFRTLTKIK